jgi:hypothetical protein
MGIVEADKGIRQFKHEAYHEAAAKIRKAGDEGGAMHRKWKI